MSQKNSGNRASIRDYFYGVILYYKDFYAPLEMLLLK